MFSISLGPGVGGCRPKGFQSCRLDHSDFFGPSVLPRRVLVRAGFDEANNKWNVPGRITEIDQEHLAVPVKLEPGFVVVHPDALEQGKTDGTVKKDDGREK